MSLAGHAPPIPPSSSWSSDDQEWELVSSARSPAPTKTTPPSLQAARPATPPPTMPGWKDEYLTALLDAEQSNPVSFDLVEACTLSVFHTLLPRPPGPPPLSHTPASQLPLPLPLPPHHSLDGWNQCSYSLHTLTYNNTGTHLNNRIATLEAEKANLESTITTNTTTTLSSSPSATAPATSSPTPQHDSLHARTRTDLAYTLTQKTHLEQRLRDTTHDRDRLLSISQSQQRTLAALTAERDALARKVRDQASELRGKKDLLQQVQDEMLALEMELNASNAARERLLKENKDLVERWMVRVAGEANAMNSRNERAGGPS